MSISRRGFLHTMMAAAVGAVAGFDIKRGLWVPGPMAADAAAVEALITEVPTGPIAKIAEEVLEANDLALQFAKRMGERIARQRMATVQEVLFKQAGGALALRKGARILEVPDRGVGVFTPHRHRVVTTVETSQKRTRAIVDEAVSGYRIPRDVDMFVPIAGELRPGVAFTGDVIIGVATDPETGLSARALKYRQYNGWSTVDVVGFEMACGTWRPERVVRREVAMSAFDDRWEIADWGDTVEFEDEHGNTRAMVKGDWDDRERAFPEEE